MSEPNQPAQNYEIQSPILETQVRSLLPSVAGYGGLLRSTNTIVPVIDLTAAAEGSTIPEFMQTAIAFGSQTAFSITNTTTVIANVPGFYRIFGMSYNTNRGVVGSNVGFTMTDGASTKIIWNNTMVSASTDASNAIQYDFIVFLASGESISGVSSSTASNLIGSVRQVATSDGTLVQPNGFPV